jgi:hypothetical protein
MRCTSLVVVNVIVMHSLVETAIVEAPSIAQIGAGDQHPARDGAAKEYLPIQPQRRGA